MHITLPGVVLCFTGKTTYAYWMAKTMQVPLYVIEAATLEDSYVGEDAKLFTALFKAMQLVAPCILFFDEAEQFFPSRSDPNADKHSLKNVSQRLPFLSGNQVPVEGLFIIIACNYYDKLDSAVISRMQLNRIEIPPPDESQRRKMYCHQLKTLLRSLFQSSMEVNWVNWTDDCDLIQTLSRLPHPNNARDVSGRSAEVLDYTLLAIWDFMQKQENNTSQTIVTLSTEQLAELTNLRLLDVTNKSAPMWKYVKQLKSNITKGTDELIHSINFIWLCKY